MSRPVILCTAAWADVPLEELAARAADWGYQGLDLCCWGDHLEVQRALDEEAYCPQKLALLSRHDLLPVVVSCPRVGQLLAGPIAAYQRRLVPDYVWGDGDAAGVRQRATEEVLASVRVAQKLGVTVVSTASGSSWQLLVGEAEAFAAQELRQGVEETAAAWTPVLQACQEAGVRLALEVGPGRLPFDLPTAELLLEAVEAREELGFTFDPAALYWQGIDPTEFLRRFAERIYHVQVTDVALTWNGRSSLLATYLPAGDPRRAWHHRAPGHGGLDWENILRTLQAIGYEGPLAVAWRDPQMDRDYGAAEACRFLKRLDFPPAARSGPN